MPAPLALVAGLKVAADKLIDTLNKSIAYAEAGQKASLALGLSLTQSRDMLGPSIEGLRGSIDKQMGIGLVGMAAGLKGNTNSVSKLMNQQQLTGQQYVATAKIFAQVQEKLGLTNPALNRLASSVLDSSYSYGVHSELLTRAIGNLSQHLTKANFAGFNETLVGAMANLQAKLGPEFDDSLKMAMGQIMDTSQEAWSQLTLLGVGNLREQMMQAKTVDQMTNILETGFKKMSTTAGEFGQGVKGLFSFMGAVEDMAGRGGMEAKIIGDKLKKNIDEVAIQNRSVFKTLSTFSDEALSPLVDLFANTLYPIVLDLSQAFSGIFKILSEKFKGWIEGFITDDRIRSMQESILNFSITAVDTLQYFIQKLAGTGESVGHFGSGLDKILQFVDLGFPGQMYESKWEREETLSTFHVRLGDMMDAVNQTVPGQFIPERRLDDHDIDLYAALNDDVMNEEGFRRHYKGMLEDSGFGADTPEFGGQILEKMESFNFVFNEGPKALYDSIEAFRQSLQVQELETGRMPTGRWADPLVDILNALDEGNSNTSDIADNTDPGGDLPDIFRRSNDILSDTLDRVLGYSGDSLMQRLVDLTEEGLDMGAQRNRELFFGIVGIE